tara:strand:+ start:634 stop:1932 length:1299 start_codon:yes stop_codon:yes gene_type:complete
MIEYIFIFLAIFIFFLIITIPTKKIFFYRIVEFKSNIFDYCTVNLLFFSNTLLLLAILKIDISTIIFIVSALYIISILLFHNHIKEKIFQFDNLFFFIFFGLIFFILSVNIASNLTLGWDAQDIWFPRAINFYNGLNFTEVSQHARKPEYPFFGSLGWAFFWKLFYFDKEYYGRIFYLLIFLVSVFNFSDLLKISMIKKIFFSLLLILLIYDYWHFRGFQEILIFSFLLIVSKYLYYIICENKIELKYLFIVFITSNLIIWTKNEGIFFSFFIYLLLTIFSKFSLKIKFINFILFASIVFIRFFVFETNNLTVDLHSNIDFENIYSIFLFNFTINNLKIILVNLILTTFKFPIIFVSLLISLIIFFSNIKSKKILFLYFYFLLNIIFIFGTYLSTTMDINFMVVTGLNRVFFESSALYLLFGLFYLKHKFKI